LHHDFTRHADDYDGRWGPAYAGRNNNAYCQDNETSWFDWSLVSKHAGLLRFVQLLIGHCLVRDTTEEPGVESLIHLLRESGECGQWSRCIDTNLAPPEDIVTWDGAPPVLDRFYRAAPHSVVVLFSSISQQLPFDSIDNAV
jgi:hypothetical protein